MAVYARIENPNRNSSAHDTRKESLGTSATLVVTGALLVVAVVKLRLLGGVVKAEGRTYSFCHLETSASLVVTSALLVVTRSY